LLAILRSCNHFWLASYPTELYKFLVQKFMFKRNFMRLEESRRQAC